MMGENAWEFLENSNSLYSTAFYFSDPWPEVSSIQNSFIYFNYAEFGGAFFLDNVMFTEDGSEYKSNSALNGGAIYCSVLLARDQQSKV